MEPIETQVAALKAQVQAQAVQISRLNAELDKLRARLPWLTLERFDLFPKLLPELRNRIWKYSLPAPRLITIGLKDDVPLNTVDVDRGNGFKRRASHKNLGGSMAAFTKLHEMPALKSPVLLYVCKESRQLALSVFDFCLSTSLDASAVVTRTVWVLIQGPLSRENQQRCRILPWLRDQERQQYIVPHNEITSPGFRFRPAYDTIFLKVDDSEIWSILTSAEPTELKADKIQSLAISLTVFKQMPF
ncbi:hypothetical protein DL95DRAFT_488261 [Leptodontidium sp. 2 PMI_412]|nr:hypothetical protein DL95DRAFT_488261 [Leptodontidium sp. 2 PMI_412]